MVTLVACQLVGGHACGDRVGPRGNVTVWDESALSDDVTTCSSAVISR